MKTSLRGGARPGAGRPKKVAQPAVAAPVPMQYDSAMEYLQAIARGLEIGDPLRIAAARAVLAYESPKQRPIAKSLAPEKLRAAAERTAEKEAVADFKRRADAARRKILERTP